MLVPMTSPLALVILLCAAAAEGPRPVVSVLYFENSTGDAALDVLRRMERTGRERFRRS